MNYLYICNYAANYSGNFIFSLLRLIFKVERSNNIYLVFPVEAQKKEWTKLFGKYNINFCNFSNKELRKTLQNLKLNSEQTIVHTHFVEDFNILPIKKEFKRIFCHYHCTIQQSNNIIKRYIKQIIRNLIYKNIVIIAVSPALGREIKEYFKYSNCEYITNAVDFNKLKNNNYPKKVKKEKFEKQIFKILIFGTDFYRKGVDIAIKAILKMEENIKLYIATHNIFETKRNIEIILGDKIISKIEVINVIENVEELYNSVDLFISPSRKEAFGYAVVESAYCDCQVLASDIPGQDFMKIVPKIIWIEKENIDSLIAGIKKAYNNKEEDKIDIIKKEQREFVISNFKIDEWAEKNISLYKKYY